MSLSLYGPFRRVFVYLSHFSGQVLPASYVVSSIIDSDDRWPLAQRRIYYASFAQLSPQDSVRKRFMHLAVEITYAYGRLSYFRLRRPPIDRQVAAAAATSVLRTVFLYSFLPVACQNIVCSVVAVSVRRSHTRTTRSPYRAARSWRNLRKKS